MVRVDELIEVITYSFSTKGRRRQPGGYACPLCGHTGGRGKGKRRCQHVFPAGANNSFRRPPLAPHPTILDNDDNDGIGGCEYDDDPIKVLGGMFETAIVRRFDDDDPRLFKLPPVFSGQDPAQSKGGRIVPLVSESTYLTTNRRSRHEGGDQREVAYPETTDGVRFPRLSSQQITKDDRGRQADPRRLNSERVDRREQLLQHDFDERSGSALYHADLGSSGPRGRTRPFLESRELTDPPPQRMIVSIKNQAGEVLQIRSMDNHDDFDDAKENRRAVGRKMKKQREGRSGIRSPSSNISGAITFSREATVSEDDSPDQTFLSRLRSARWCQCSDHVIVSARCPECRKTSGNHEKWCVCRNTLCSNCDKPFKGKYQHLERKSSFGAMPGMSGMQANVPEYFSSSIPSDGAGYYYSGSKTIDPSRSAGAAEENPASNRVRFTEDGKTVSPEWQDSGFEDYGESNNLASALETASYSRFSKMKVDRAEQANNLTSTSIDADVHRRAYDLALASSHTKRLLQQHKRSRGSDVAPKGVYFSYFPLLKTKRPRASEDEGETTIFPQLFGVRADEREGKKLKVKKGLKHVLGDTKLEDFYPGGKGYPKTLAPHSKRNL